MSAVLAAFAQGKRGRGAAGEIPVFGILKRDGKVHTVMIPDVRKDTLLPIIRQKVDPDSMVYTDCYPAYDVLTSPSSTTIGSTTQTPMFSIATITSTASKTSGTRQSAPLRQYNSIPKAHFPLLLKQT
jgi:transposase